MNAPIKITLTPNDLLLLKNSVNTPHSPLSPLGASLDPHLVSGETNLSAELSGHDGQLRQELSPAIETLSNAEAYGMLTYIGEGIAFETAVYYPPDGNANPPASLSLTDEALLLESPPPIDGLLEHTTQYIGESLIRVSNLELETNLADGWVLFAVLDTVRRVLLNRVLTGGSAETIFSPLEKVKRSLEPNEDEFQWLASYYASCTGIQPLSEDELQQSLQRLGQHGFWEVQGNILQIQPSFENLAREFIILDGHMRLQAASLEDGSSPVSNTVRTIHGRANAILLWTHDQQAANFWCISPAQAGLILSTVIETPAENFSGEAFAPIQSLGMDAEQTIQSAGPTPDQLAQPAQTIVSAQPLPAEEGFIAAEPPKKNRRKWLWIILGAIGLVGACCVSAVVVDYLFF